VARLAARLESSVFATMAAALAVCLSQLGGKPEVAVGTVVANRRIPEFEQTIGFFVNAVTLRVDLRDNPSFKMLVRRIHATLAAALDHQELGFGAVIEGVDRVAPPGRDNPFYQGMFVLQKDPLTQLRLNGVSADMLCEGFDVARAEFVIEVTERASGYVGGVYYDRDLFYERVIRHLTDAFLCILGAAVAAPLSSADELGRAVPHLARTE
jgi:non-ribosomal peptide synthetase component F